MGTGGLDFSSTASNTSCSARLSTSARVATTCCASTARQSSSLQGAASDATARGVQVLEDMDQSFGGQDTLSRFAAKRVIAGMEPVVHCLRFSARDGRERA